MKWTLACLLSLNIILCHGQVLSGIDPGFGTGGLNAFDLTGARVRPQAIQRRPDGGHTVVGMERILIASDADGYYQVGFGHYGQQSNAYQNSTLFGQFFMRSTPTTDGGVLVIGESLFGVQTSNLIALDADGVLDPSFSGDGLFSLTSGNAQLFFWDVLRMDDGRTLASGYWSDDQASMVVIRLLANGTLDPSFGSGGIAEHQVDETGGLLRLTADGSILCGRGAFNRGFARLLPNGDLDPSFASGGVLSSFPFQPTVFDVNDFVPAPDGSIIVLSDLSIRRLAPDLSADLGFPTGINGGGIRVALQPDGKIVQLESSSVLTRLLPSGALDPTFNGIGSVNVAQTGDIATNFIIEPDVSYTTVGFDQFGEVFIARTSNSGQPITSYGDGGKAEFSGEGGGEIPQALGIRPNGAITCLGNGLIGIGAGNPVPCTYIAQFDANGTRDQSFSNDGVHKDLYMNGHTIGYSSNGSLLIYGQSAQSFISTPRLVRYLADGTLDPSFAGNLNFNQGIFQQLPYPLSSSGDMTVAPTDHVYLSAWRSPTPEGPTRAGIKRFLPNGSLDPGFGINGEFIYDPGVDCGAFQLSTFQNGDLLAAILVDDSVDFSYLYRNELHLVRLSPEGTLVPTFGTGGVVETSIGGLLRHVTLTRLAFLSDERFVIGAAPDTDPNTFQVARFLADGQPDLSLDGDGVVSFDSISTNYAGFDAQNLLVHPDGSMMLVGGGYNGPGIYFQKVLADGTPDLLFGGNGVFFLDPEGYSLSAPSAVLTASNEVIVGAQVQYTDNTEPPAIVLDHVLFRLMPDLQVGAELLGATLDRQVLVFPNPSSEGLTIEVPADLNGRNIEYRLIDTQGRTVSSGSFNASNNGGTPHQVRLPGPFPAGEYVLDLRAEDAMRTVKVIFAP